MQTAAVKESPQALTQEWSEWHWQDNKIIRHQQQNWNVQEECSDRAHLENHLRVLRKLKQELLNRAATSQGSRKEDFEEGAREKERQIEYVVQRLEELNSTSKLTSRQRSEGAMPESVAVEVVEELSESEERDRLHLERRVERAVFDGARALRELRDRRLYRSTHSTFEEYCQERFGYKRRHSYQLIDAANVVDNLLAAEDGDTMCAIGAQNETVNSSRQSLSGDSLFEEEAGSQEPQIILPTSERQVRDIAKLSPEQQREVWQQAVEVSVGKLPSGRIVKDIVQRIRERTPVPNPYQIGEICRFVPKDNPELKGKSKCWAIVKEVHDFSCTVQAWDGEYQVRIENLKSQELSPGQREEVERLCDRITQLPPIDTALDPSARAFLRNLGEQLALTELGAKMLFLIEEHYQVVAN